MPCTCESFVPNRWKPNLCRDCGQQQVAGDAGAALQGTSTYLEKAQSKPEAAVPKVATPKVATSEAITPEAALPDATTARPSTGGVRTTEEPKSQAECFELSFSDSEEALADGPGVHSEWMFETCFAAGEETLSRASEARHCLQQLEKFVLESIDHSVQKDRHQAQQNRIYELENELRRDSLEKETLCKRLQDQHAEFACTARRCEEQKQKVQQLEGLLQAERVATEALQKLHDKLQDELQSLRTEKYVLETLCKQQRQDIQDSDARLERTVEELKAQQQEISRLETLLQTANGQFEKLQAERQSHMTDVQQELQTVRSEKENLETLCNRLQDQHREFTCTARRCEEQQRELQELKRLLEAEHVAKEMLEGLHQELQGDVLEQLELAFKELEERCLTLPCGSQTQCETESGHQELLQDCFEQLELAFNSTQQQTEQLRRELESHRLANKSLQDLCQKHQDQEETMQSRLDELEKKFQETCLAKEQLEWEVQEWQTWYDSDGLQDDERTDEQTDERTCTVCQAQIEDTSDTVLSCGHHFHRTCIQRWHAVGAAGASFSCPNCRSHVDVPC